MSGSKVLTDPVKLGPELGELVGQRCFGRAHSWRVPPLGVTTSFVRDPGCSIESPLNHQSKSSTAASIAAAAKTAATPTAGTYDGLYAGPVCFGKTALEPSRCFRAEGTITRSKLIGKWVTGPKSNITMFLDGDVSPSGDLKIEMHSENSAGARIATIDLKGTVHERTLIADGTFRMGRPANINWQKIPPAHH